ncbi:TRAP transporter small permease [Selenihalanaerobacter shriftii]|uniref:TRAP-type C4-dicarboxylate transport system, small permease component n=1 Tax=Selenihalanaerobacter shriftii TaxID=142842 RepID=A0A1T4R1H7_9FIRM|nr:TRAP transporter small permease [Selenihalanaerobacter shriftii]SKA09902.1 TRAP-type C4-dicarboxylate transport system, small permease component [Selenihalanaerobacter shriftii]
MKPSNLFFKINNLIRSFEKFILTYGIIALAALTVGNVISRRAFNYSWTFTEEISQFILVILTFMGISYAIRVGRHIRMSAFYDLMNETAQRIMMIIVSLVTSLILFYLAYHAGLYVLETKHFGRVTPTLMVPFYLIIIWAPIGLFLGGVQYILTFIKNIKGDEAWLSYEEKSDYKDFDVDLPPTDN